MIDRFEVKDKDPNFIYRWCNTDERAMLHRQDQGYEVVKFDSPELPKELVAGGDIIPAPGGVARRRGTDLILCRIRKDVHDENVGSKVRAARERHSGAIDTMVAQAKENAERAMRAAGLTPGTSGPLVFKDTAEKFK